MYGSVKKICLSVFSALLTYDCVCWEPRSQRVTLSLWCESRILGSRTAVSVTIDITLYMTASECGLIQTKTNGEWTNHSGSLLLMFSWQWCRREYCHNILLTVFWLNPVQNYSRDQDKITHTMSCWVSVLVLTGVRCVSTGLTHRLETVILCYKAQLWVTI